MKKKENKETPKKLNILKVRNDFRNEMMRELGGLYDGKAILKQITKTINGKNDFAQLILISQLNVYCIGSARRCKLLRHRVGEEDYNKLLQFGLYNYEGHPISEIQKSLETLNTDTTITIKKLTEKLDILKIS